MLIHLICAARPNFMKVAPLYHALKKEPWADPKIIHTGQHYDVNMSDAFFKDLNLPDPHIHLGVGSGSHAEQTGKVMIAYEKVLMEEKPDLVVVVGDVNSTVACSLAASKISYSSASQLPSLQAFQLGQRPIVAHLEAGLRSFDRTMPEEINRMVTDVLADILWTPSPDGDENLIKEGISPDKIHMVGNIMIDSLEMLRDKIESQCVYKEFGLKPKGYGLVTMHRPSNVDDPKILKNICLTLANISKKIPIIFPIHPRTRKTLESNDLMKILTDCKAIHIPEPIPYIRFMNLVFNCALVVTDSGGIQEETTHLGIPCLTMRPNTERPITITQGTNKLCKIENIVKEVEDILDSRFKIQNAKFINIKYWDGKTAERIVEFLKGL
jgi:UDP-N-acetylglucosamine 2-epimerase (non-hydrolysing)